MSDKETTNAEILNFLQEHMVMKEDFNGLEGKVDSLEGKVDSLEGKVDSLEGKVDDLTKTVANLPNKSYLDDKLADLEGSVTTALRREDNKVNMILEILEQHKVVPTEDIERVRRIKLFPTAPEVS